MRRFRYHYVLYFLLIFILFFHAIKSFGFEKRQPEVIKLKLLLLPFLSFAPFFIASEEGFFAEQRLQIEFVKMSNTATAIPSLVQGDLDIVGTNIRVNLLNAILRDGRIKFVADKGHLTSSACSYYSVIGRRMLVKPGEPDTADQLKGRRISIGAGLPTTAGYFAEKLANTVGLTLNDVEIVEHLPHPAELEALEKGSIDYIIDGEPKVTRIIQTGHGILWKSVQQFAPDFQYDVVVYGPTLIQKNPEAGKKFMVAYLKAVRQFNQGKTERNLEILSKHTGLDRELLGKACWPQFRIDGKINVKSVLDFQDWAIKKGLLDKPALKNQFWDPSFVEYANKVLEASTK
jgi:NitT/TauT family transport system substrate-binding protein